VCVCVCHAAHSPAIGRISFSSTYGASTESCNAETTSHTDSQQSLFCAISGFGRGVNILSLLACYAAYIGSWLPTFRDNLSVPFSRANGPRKKFSRVYFTEDHAVQALTGACEQQFGRVQGDIICSKESPSQLRCTLFNPANKNLWYRYYDKQ
jgi:hypothetical protein